MCSSIEHWNNLCIVKLAHALEYLQCSEVFAMGKSTIHLMFYEFVHGINEVFKKQTKWP